MVNISELVPPGQADGAAPTERKAERPMVKTATLLGTAEAPEITTRINWKTRAKTAYLARRDLDRMKRRTLALALANRLGEIMEVDIASALLAGPQVRIDGTLFRIHERVAPYGSMNADGELYLTAEVRCPFCDRPNEREFSTLEDLGEVLVSPAGECFACGKALAAR